MKKFLLLPLVLFVALIFPSSEAKAFETPMVSHLNSYASATYSASHVRVRYFTRNVRYGRFVYRETYRVTFFRDGRYHTRLINRYRIGRFDDYDRY